MIDQFVQQAKAIADPTRVRMLKLLEHGELCVCQVMMVLQLGQSTASKHLGILKRAGLVETRKNGTWSYYRLAEDAYRTGRTCLSLLSCLDSDGSVNGDRQALVKVRKRAFLRKSGHE